MARFSRVLMPPKPSDGPRLKSFQPPQGALSLIAGSASPLLAGKIASALGVRLTPSEAHYFSEGKRLCSRSRKRSRS